MTRGREAHAWQAGAGTSPSRGHSCSRCCSWGRRWVGATCSATTWSGCPTWPCVLRSSASARLCRVRCRRMPSWRCSTRSCQACCSRSSSCSACSPLPVQGAARLTEDSLVARLVAVTVYVWSPFVAERLVVGHWPVLVGYAALPWVVDAARAWRATGRLPLRLWWLVPLGSLSASAGLATAVALVAFAVARGRARWLVALVVAGNVPWLVSGVLHAGDAVTSATGASTFALHGEGSVPAPLAALTLGGIWNSEVVPSSRTGVLGWVSLRVSRRAGRSRFASVAHGRWPTRRPGIPVVLDRRFRACRPHVAGAGRDGLAVRPRPRGGAGPGRFPPALPFVPWRLLPSPGTAPRPWYDACLLLRGRASRSRW